MRLRYRRGVILLGISRNGVRLRERLRETDIQAGDLLLFLGPEDTLDDVIEWLGCLPLAPRGLEVIQRDKARKAIVIFAGAILLASLELLYLPIALACVVVLYLVLDIVPLSQVYESIEWPVIVLLGAMIPISVALENTGGTQLIAGGLCWVRMAGRSCWCCADAGDHDALGCAQQCCDGADCRTNCPTCGRGLTGQP